ncbi:hypothetical protein BDD43_4231 [Mucilaginibacter gracilis]|uniref:Uncharacterized protein n=1 Tax=Mucilaginibacter gracilis TaxID=423350 RepID=A0A495J5I2_9SPHI|nr:hypothetical protein BDD43_4231 [Mucilaginibacter gracilis]
MMEKVIVFKVLKSKYSFIPEHTETGNNNIY